MTDSLLFTKVASQADRQHCQRTRNEGNMGSEVHLHRAHVIDMSASKLSITTVPNHELIDMEHMLHTVRWAWHMKLTSVMRYTWPARPRVRS